MSKKNFWNWLTGIALAVGGFLAALFAIRKRNIDPGRIQRGDEIIDGLESEIEASAARNKNAQEHVGKAEEHIDSAIESIDNAQAILERAKKRSEKKIL